MSGKVKGGLRTSEKVGASCKKRVHFSDEAAPVSLADGTCAAVLEDAQIRPPTDAKSCRFAVGLVEVFSKASIDYNVNSCATSADSRQFEANADAKSCHSEEQKSSSAEGALAKAVNISVGNVTELISHESPCTPPSCGSLYGLAILDNGRSNHSNTQVHRVQRKLTFVVGAGDQMHRKCGSTNKKTLSRVQNYKVVPESEGAFSTALSTPHLNAMHTFGSSEGACKKRCAWISPHSDAVYVAYHDEEWGVPVHEDRRLFEMLVFAGAQTEIAWSSILTKREAYRDAFAQFDPAILATYDMAKVALLKSHRDIMKSETRVQSIVSNAKLVMKIVEEFGSFSEYLWRFVRYKPIVSKYKQAKSIPTRTAKSEAISKDLQRRGMRHAGPMVIYSFMQAAGLANDHLLSCFRHPSSSSPSSSSASASPSPSLLSPPSTRPLVSAPLCC